VKFKLEREFQETEIGKIPKDWRVKKLLEIVEVWDKYRIPVKETNRKPGPYPYCGANGIIDYVDGYTHDGEFVLLAEDGGFFGPFEKSAYIMRGKFWANNHVHVLKPRKEFTDSEYLMYFLNYIDLTPYVTGTTRPKLNQVSMKKIPITLPPINEQKRIAEILSLIDRVVESVDESIAKLERLKKALMRELLTGRIRVNEENGKLVFHRETEFQETEIGKIPKDWKVVKIKDIYTFAKRGKTPKYGNSDLVVIKTAQNYPDNIRFEEAPRASKEFFEKLPEEFYLKPDDILINSTGTGSVGRVGFFEGYHKPCTVDGHITILRVKQDLVNPKYVFYYLSSPYGQKILLSKATGSTHQVELYVNEILDVLVPLPFNKTEQTKITKVLNTIDNTIKSYHREKARLDRLKKGLMNLLLTGKIRVLE
jgi:type I restriction enzyme S subunit